MKATVILAMASLCVVPLLAGCANRYEVTFVNGTDEDMNVSLRGPGEIEPNTVPIARNGGEAAFEIEVDDDELPANYEWMAGDRRGSVPINDESKREQVVHIPR